MTDFQFVDIMIIPYANSFSATSCSQNFNNSTCLYIFQNLTIFLKTIIFLNAMILEFCSISAQVSEHYILQLSRSFILYYLLIQITIQTESHFNF